MQHAFIADDASLATPLGLVPLQGLPAPSLRARLRTASRPALQDDCCQSTLLALRSAVPQQLTPLALCPCLHRYRMPKPPFAVVPPQHRPSPESRTCLATAWRFARPPPERDCLTPLSSTTLLSPPTEPGFRWLPQLRSLGSVFPPLRNRLPKETASACVPPVPRLRCRLVCPTVAAAQRPPPRGCPPAPTGALDTLPGPTRSPSCFRCFTTEVAPPLPQALPACWTRPTCRALPLLHHRGGSTASKHFNPCASQASSSAPLCRGASDADASARGRPCRPSWGF